MSAAVVTSSFADTTVLDERGNPTVLGSLWQDRPILLALVRHFG
jgi:hypothetical protein